MEVKQQPAASSQVVAALGLHQPLRLSTRVPLDERRVHGMWQRIEQRTGPGSRRALLAPVRLAWAVPLALVLLLGLAWSRLGSVPDGTAAGPLLTAAGQRFERLEAGEQRAERVLFADGSQIEVAPGARVEGLAATESELVVLLRRGRARFSVTPGGTRRWSIEARGARVEVVGTVFTVESHAGSFAVQVERGAVLVRSPLLADGVQRLSAGEALRLDVGGDAEQEPAAELPLPAPLSEPLATGQSMAEPPAPRRSLRATPAPLQGAPEAAGARGRRLHSPARAPQQRTPAANSALELWAQADAARRAGEARRAAQLLEQLIAQHPRDSQAGLAAYTLGGLLQEQLGAPRTAAQRFAQARQLGLVTALRESSYLRQAEALLQAGQHAAARQLARHYLRAFPLGQHRDALQQLVTGRVELGGPTRQQGEVAR